MTKEDIKSAVVEIETNPNYSVYTKLDYKMTLRRFYKWFKGNNEKIPEEVSWMKMHTPAGHRLPEELLTEEEVIKMSQAAGDIREKVLILCLYETGCRISEILTLQLKNIKFDEYGVVLVVNGKTGSRRVRIVSSAPALSSWLEVHPVKDNPEAYLFPRKQKANPNAIGYRYEYAQRRIKQIAKDAGINKRVYPHLFRHSRATALATKLTEAQMKENFGWVQASDMASVYVHLSGRDVDEAILALHGIKQKEDNKQESLRTTPCPRCKDNNSPSFKFCTKCGAPMSPEIAINAENEAEKAGNLLKVLMKDEEFKEMMLKKLMVMNGGDQQANPNK